MRGARCFRTGTQEHPRQWAVTDEQRSRWPGAAPPRRAGAVWLSGVVARSLQTPEGYARRSRLARQPNSRQQNRKLFLNRPLASLRPMSAHSHGCRSHLTARTGSIFWAAFGITRRFGSKTATLFLRTSPRACKDKSTQSWHSARRTRDNSRCSFLVTADNRSALVYR